MERLVFPWDGCMIVEDAGPDGKYPEPPDEAYMVVKEDTTCFKCPDNGTCEYAWDPYNTHGDCLMDK